MSITYTSTGLIHRIVGERDDEELPQERDEPRKANRGDKYVEKLIEMGGATGPELGEIFGTGDLTTTLRRMADRGRVKCMGPIKRGTTGRRQLFWVAIQ